MASDDEDLRLLNDYGIGDTNPLANGTHLEEIGDGNGKLPSNEHLNSTLRNMTDDLSNDKQNETQILNSNEYLEEKMDCEEELNAITKRQEILLANQTEAERNQKNSKGSKYIERTNAQLIAEITQLKALHSLDEKKNKMLEEKIEKLEEKLAETEANAKANSYSRSDTGKAVPIRNINPHKHIVRDLYKCRCEKMCKFSFRDVQSNSPTHFARMMNLVKVLQEKHGLSEMTDLEKYNAIPRGVIAHIPMLAHKVINNVVADVPNGETWLILSKCASLPLWIRDIVGWEAAFSFHRAVALQEVLGVHLLKPGKTWLYLMPGVKREKVCLEADHEYLLDEDPNLTTEKIRKDLKVNGKGMIILVTPASEQYQDLELWQTAVTAIPPSFEVVVIPTFVQNEDFESLERCGKNMEQLIRDGNAPLKVYSMNKKPSGYRNRSIATISDGMRNEYEYFKFIQEVVEAESPTMAIRVAKAPTGNSSKTQLMQLHDDNDCGIDAIATTSSDIATTSSGGGPMRQRMGHIKKPWKRNEYQGGRGARGGGSFRRH